MSADTVEGMTYLHEQGWIHCDLGAVDILDRRTVNESEQNSIHIYACVSLIMIIYDNHNLMNIPIFAILFVL